ncbi:MAG: type II toxin-antitoxin system RelE/ParE family toxin [Desulfovibrio sp.]|nr:type II toxin-antitoxin system RelE/ParE family toxin [Desulfovibrio sp.]
MQIHWTHKARQDRLEILQYIAENNLDAAERMDQRFKDATDSLLSFPYKGRIGRVNGTFELVIHQNYILVYVVNGKEISISALIHTARKYPPK